MGSSFKKTERILKRKDFSAVYAGGKRFYSSSFVVIVRGHAQLRRIGVVVSKRVGKAHRRNRIKRLLREFYRLNSSLFPTGMDIIVIANRPTKLDNLQQVGVELSEVLSKCSRLKHSEV